MTKQTRRLGLFRGADGQPFEVVGTEPVEPNGFESIAVALTNGPLVEFATAMRNAGNRAPGAAGDAEKIAKGEAFCLIARDIGGRVLGGARVEVYIPGSVKRLVLPPRAILTHLEAGDGRLVPVEEADRAADGRLRQQGLTVAALLNVVAVQLAKSSTAGPQPEIQINARSPQHPPAPDPRSLAYWRELDFSSPAFTASWGQKGSYVTAPAPAVEVSTARLHGLQMYTPA